MTFKKKQSVMYTHISQHSNFVQFRNRNMYNFRKYNSEPKIFTK